MVGEDGGGEKSFSRVILLLEGEGEKEVLLLETVHEKAEETSKLFHTQLICTQHSVETDFNPNFCCTDGWLETEEN